MPDSPDKAESLPAGSALETLLRGLCERVARGGGAWAASSCSRRTSRERLPAHRAPPFLVQLEGSTCWQVGARPGRAAPVQDELREELLAAGDVLYLPPETWWRTFPLGRSCVLSLLQHADA